MKNIIEKAKCCGRKSVLWTSDLARTIFEEHTTWEKFKIKSINFILGQGKLVRVRNVLMQAVHITKTQYRNSKKIFSEKEERGHSPNGQCLLFLPQKPALNLVALREKAVILVATAIGGGGCGCHFPRWWCWWLTMPLAAWGWSLLPTRHCGCGPHCSWRRRFATT